MSAETSFKKTICEQPWDWKTINEYEEVTLRQQPKEIGRRSGKMGLNMPVSYMSWGTSCRPRVI